MLKQQLSTVKSTTQLEPIYYLNLLLNLNISPMVQCYVSSTAVRLLMATSEADENDA